MAPWKQKINFEIMPISGCLRVTVHAEPDILGTVVQAAVVGAVVWIASRAFKELPWVEQGLLALAVGSAFVGIVQMLRHRYDVIEFGSEKLRIGRSILGLARTAEYPVDKCRDLTWRVPDDDNQYPLECKVGVRQVGFGAGISAQQAQEILAALQQHLPEVAQKMGMSLENQKSHFTRLGLS